LVEERRREADEVVEKARVVFAKVMEMMYEKAGVEWVEEGLQKVMDVVKRNEANITVLNRKKNLMDGKMKKIEDGNKIMQDRLNRILEMIKTFQSNFTLDVPSKKEKKRKRSKNGKDRKSKQHKEKKGNNELKKQIRKLPAPNLKSPAMFSSRNSYDSSANASPYPLRRTSVVMQVMSIKRMFSLASSSRKASKEIQQIPKIPTPKRQPSPEPIQTPQKSLSQISNQTLTNPLSNPLPNPLTNPHKP